MSIGLIDEGGRTYYAELSDYDANEVDGWIKDHVLANFTGEHVITKKQLADELREWLGVYDNVEIWSDCLAYDWVLFNDIFGTAFDIPKNVYYIPFDICTLFKLQGVDPDVSREKYAAIEDMDAKKHNSLWDARVIRACYDKLLAS